MTKKLVLSLAATAAFIGCKNWDSCKSCGGGSGHAESMNQVPASPNTPAYAGKAMQQSSTPTAAGAGNQNMMPSQGMPMPNAMATKPAGMDAMQR